MPTGEGRLSRRFRFGGVRSVRGLAEGSAARPDAPAMQPSGCCYTRATRCAHAGRFVRLLAALASSASGLKIPVSVVRSRPQALLPSSDI